MEHLESYDNFMNEKKPAGAPDWHDSDAPDANGRFRDLSPKDLAAWLIKTRKKDLKRISGSLTQQVVFNRNEDPEYADKMERTRKEVYKQLGREDLLKESLNERILLIMKDVVSRMVSDGFGYRTSPKMKEELKAAIKDAITPILKKYNFAVQESEVNEEDGRDTLAELTQMTMSQLERIEDYAEMIKDRMEEGQELDSWMFSQITVALENLNAVHDSLAGDEELEESNAKPGPDAYMTGLDKEEEEDKEDQIKKQSKMDDDDPEAYKEMPGDEEAREKGKVKTSKHVKSYHELYGEETDESTTNESIRVGKVVAIKKYNPKSNRYEMVDVRITDYIKKPGSKDFVEYELKGKKSKVAINVFNSMLESVINEEKAEGDRGKIDDSAIESGLKKKSEETGVPIALLRIVMRRGMAAWKSGHRPGATQQQWGYARVNSFLTKQPGTWGGADSDVAKEVRDGGHDKNLKKA